MKGLFALLLLTTAASACAQRYTHVDADELDAFSGKPRLSVRTATAMGSGAYVTWSWRAQEGLLLLDFTYWGGGASVVGEGDVLKVKFDNDSIAEFAATRSEVPEHNRGGSKVTATYRIDKETLRRFATDRVTHVRMHMVRSFVEWSVDARRNNQVRIQAGPQYLIKRLRELGAWD